MKNSKKLLSKNAQYIVVCSLIVGLLAMFFTSMLWISDDRENKTHNYDITLQLTNAWDVKVSDAIYDPNALTLTVSYFAKEKQQGKAAEPYISKVTLGNSTAEQLNFETKAHTENPDFGRQIVITGVPAKWYYLRIYISSRQNDTQKPPSLDEFGNTITYPVDEGETATIFVSIDGRSIEWLPLIVPETSVN